MRADRTAVERHNSDTSHPLTKVSRRDSVPPMTSLAAVSPQPSGNTPRRAFRVPDDLYLRAQNRALKEKTTLSSVVRDALEDYVKGAKR